MLILGRHPTPSARPNFSEVLASLLKDNVLSIPRADKRSHPDAGMLGANLEAGLEMYKDLQNTYLGHQTSSPSPKAKRYTTMDKQRTAKLGSQKTRVVRTEEGGNSLSQGQYEVEEETEINAGYQNV
jgi:hypothetical protein